MPEYVCCDDCGGELDGTGTCPNDCLAPITDEEFEAKLTEQLVVGSPASRDKEQDA